MIFGIWGSVAQAVTPCYLNIEEPGTMDVKTISALSSNLISRYIESVTIPQEIELPDEDAHSADGAQKKKKLNQVSEQKKSQLTKKEKLKQSAREQLIQAGIRPKKDDSNFDSNCVYQLNISESKKGVFLKLKKDKKVLVGGSEMPGLEGMTQALLQVIFYSLPQPKQKKKLCQSYPTRLNQECKKELSSVFKKPTVPGFSPPKMHSTTAPKPPKINAPSNTGLLLQKGSPAMTIPAVMLPERRTQQPSIEMVTPKVPMSPTVVFPSAESKK